MTLVEMLILKRISDHREIFPQDQSLAYTQQPHNRGVAERKSTSQMSGQKTHRQILQLYIIKWPLLSATHIPTCGRSSLTIPLNGRCLIFIPCFYDRSEKTTRRLHGKVAKIITIKKPFFILFQGTEISLQENRACEIWCEFTHTHMLTEYRCRRGEPWA